MTADARCPLVVERAVMQQRWETLTFLHWSYDPEVVQALLPRGLTVETHDARAWVGLVPFHMRVGVRGTRGLPWASRFCETNVRTYVTDQHGRSGVWFFSLDAERLGAVLSGRGGYALPYFWSRMRLRREVDMVTYTCGRRWPEPAPVSSLVRVRIGSPYRPDDRDDFLTARWRLYSDASKGLRYADAQHDPWPLRRAELLDLDDDLVTAAGLPKPEGEPLVLFSEGVDVRIGAPHRVR